MSRHHTGSSVMGHREVWGQCNMSKTTLLDGLSLHVLTCQSMSNTKHIITFKSKGFIFGELNCAGLLQESVIRPLLFLTRPLTVSLYVRQLRSLFLGSQVDSLLGKGERGEEGG